MTTNGGVNVIGYLNAENGIGEAARLMVAAAESVGLPHAEISIAGPHRNLHPFVGADALQAPRPTNVVCVNADALAPVGDWLRGKALGDRPTVGWWAWEVEQFPKWMAANAAYVDEVWAYSAFERDCLARQVDVPVRVFNPPIPLSATPTSGRRSLGLPDGFLFLFSFDYLSVFDRKNPLGVLEAFTRAFRPGEGPILILKGVNASARPLERDRLVTAASGRPDVRVWHDYVDAGNQRRLIAACDAYVSLHRSEGFGLTLAEAMAAGKPVIATGYSGNLDFMDDQNSFLVPYASATVPVDAGPYPAGARWADPDVDAAADAMRRVVVDDAEVARRVAKARRDLATQHSLEARGGQLVAMLGEVARRPTRPSPSRTTQDLARTTRGRVGAILRRLGLMDDVAARLDSIDRREVELHRALVARIDDLDQSLQRLVSQIGAAPYVADDAALRVVGKDGRERMGFEATAEQSPRFYEAFEEMFRGSESFIRERLKVYLPLLIDHGPVADLGCGRGELLDLLAAAGVEAFGIEANAEIAAATRKKGHRVETSDATEALRGLPPGSLGAVFSSQFIEHLTTPAIVGLIDDARRVLRPGGVFVTETVNPHSISALKTFWLDPTHVQPVYPETLLLLCRSAGFARGYVLHPHGSGDLVSDRTSAGEYALVAEVSVPAS